MATLFDGTFGMDDIVEILDGMEANIPRPRSSSKSLWALRHATSVSDRNRSTETLLEKAVAMLAVNGHMPGWFNQCPAASGIGDSRRNRRSNVDLVHWNGADGVLTLVELKWQSDTASEAVRQILRYGAAYLYCRTHRDRLPVGDPPMSATHVALRVVAPARYYVDMGFGDRLLRARESLGEVTERAGLSELSMSIDALAFPASFRVPFVDGAEARESCVGQELSEKARLVVHGFNGLSSALPECGGTNA